jgi:hypothetical protein
MHEVWAVQTQGKACPISWACVAAAGIKHLVHDGIVNARPGAGWGGTFTWASLACTGCRGEACRTLEHAACAAKPHARCTCMWACSFQRRCVRQGQFCTRTCLQPSPLHAEMPRQLRECHRGMLASLPARAHLVHNRPCRMCPLPHCMRDLFSPMKSRCRRSPSGVHCPLHHAIAAPASSAAWDPAQDRTHAMPITCKGQSCMACSCVLRAWSPTCSVQSWTAPRKTSPLPPPLSALLALTAPPEICPQALSEGAVLLAPP